MQVHTDLSDSDSDEEDFDCFEDDEESEDNNFENYDLEDINFDINLDDWLLCHFLFFNEWI